MRDDEADVTSLGGGAKGFVGKKRSRIARCMIRCRAFGAEEAVGGVDGVSITNACAERIRELKTQNPDDANKMLRVRVDSGGCSGFQYSFSLDGDMQEEDRVFTKGDVSLVVDDVSLQFLRGATVDFTEELIKSSFEVTSNPNAESSCGCGNSFVVK